MTERQKQALALFDAGGMTQKQIAATVGFSPAALCKTITRYRGARGVREHAFPVRGDALLHIYAKARELKVKPEDVVNGLILAAMKNSRLEILKGDKT